MKEKTFGLCAAVNDIDGILGGFKNAKAVSDALRDYMFENAFDDPAKLTDDEIIAKASKAKNGEEFLRLWSGDMTGFSTGRLTPMHKVFGIVIFKAAYLF